MIKDVVGIYPGRFQGVTKAHKSIIDMMSRTYEKSYVCLVEGEKSKEDKNHNPFSQETKIEMLNRILPENVELIITSSAFLPDTVKNLEESNFALYVGADRTTSYEHQKKYLKEENKTLLIITLNLNRENISATKVREALKENDKDTFRKLVPEEIHSMYGRLRNEIL